MQSEQNDYLTTFGEIVAQALTEGLRESCTSVLTATLDSGGAASLLADAEQVSFFMGLEGALRGRARLSVKRSEIAALDMRNAPATQESETAALLQLLQTTALQLQELATARYGDVKVAMEQGTEPAASDAQTSLQIFVNSGNANTRTTLYLELEPELVTGLQDASGDLFPEATPVEPMPAENLELVLDVELNATLRFGQRQLTLREILELTSGSVVELDRQVDEPVELVLDGRVIARGEAVIIDGNYGMRITEILQSVSGGG